MFLSFLVLIILKLIAHLCVEVRVLRERIQHDVLHAADATALEVVRALRVQQHPGIQNG